MVVENTEALLVHRGVERHLRERASDSYVAADSFFSAVRLIRGTVKV